MKATPVSNAAVEPPPLDGFPAPQVIPNALHAFGGLWRLSVRRFFSLNRWLVIAGMLALLVLFAVGVAPNAERAAHAFLPWAVRFYICFLVPVLAFLSAAGVVRDDLQAGSVDYLFTRPVRRPTFVFLRYLAHVGCGQIDFLLSLAAIAFVGVYRQAPGIWSAIPLLVLAQGLMIVAFSAFGFLCAMLTSRYVVIGLVYGAVIEVGIGSVPTQLSRLSITRHALEILKPLLDGQQIGMGGPLAGEALSTPMAVLLLLGISLAMVGAAALVFGMREPGGAVGREP
jgi:ABC-2 type transport system permease protein